MLCLCYYFLLLLEPTTGLDSLMAYEVMAVVKQLTVSSDDKTCGRTCVSTIHQPAPEVFNLFSHCALISSGRCIYFGEAGDSLKQYFECAPLNYSFSLGDVNNRANAMSDGTKRKGSKLRVEKSNSAEKCLKEVLELVLDICSGNFVASNMTRARTPIELERMYQQSELAITFKPHSEQ